MNHTWCSCVLAAVVIPANVAVAQDGYEGWRELGAAIGGSEGNQERSYQRGLQQAAEIEYLMATAQAARTEARIAEHERVLRIELEGYWTKFGLPPEEAKAVASTFVLQEDQIAMLERAKREGLQATALAARRAYDSHQYLLANQLLIAAARAPVTPPPALNAEPEK